MTRLTDTMRDTIAKQAADAAFDKPKKALVKLEHKLGMMAYNSIFPAGLRKQVAALPDNWKRLDQCLRFNVNGMDIRLTVDKGVPVPVSCGYSCNRLGTITGELGDKIYKLSTDKEKANSDYRTLYHQIKGRLSSTNTIKQLAEAWPEGEPYYKQFVKTTGGGAVVLRFDDINTAIAAQGKQGA